MRRQPSDSFNTLAQSGPSSSETLRVTKPEIIVAGEGTDLTNPEVLLQRAKKKVIMNKVILGLVDICDRKGKPEQKKQYWNTYHCQESIILSNGKLHGKYCKNRICPICSGIRKAELINKYLPIIMNWDDPHFVTLTAKSVPAKLLDQRVTNILRAFKILNKKYRKRYNQSKGPRFIGIRSLECNFNPIARTYNPHLHVIVATKEMAETLVKDWLKLWTAKYTYNKAQNIQRITDPETALVEVIKYGTKIFTDPTMAKSGKAKVTPYVYLSALDNILTAMKKHRIFDRFGFDIPKPAQKKPGKFSILNDYKFLQYEPLLADWVQTENEELLTGYKLPPELQNILDNFMDHVTE